MTLLEKHGITIATTTVLTTAVAGAGIYYFYRRSLQKQLVEEKLNQMMLIFDQTDCIIKDAALLRGKLRKFIEAGKNKIQIIADFDRTLSKAKVDGLSGHSSYGVVEDSSYINADAVEQLNALKNKYFPIEMDTNIDPKDKEHLMIEWFTSAFDVSIKAGVQKRLLPAMVKESRAVLRDGADQFFYLVREYQIPLLIISAGVGDIIEEILLQQAIKPPQTKIVANYYQFDTNDVLSGFKGELIHTFNKNQASIQNKDYFQLHKPYSNVLLLGDSLGDLAMADGMDNQSSIIKIGFLNSHVEKSLPAYLSAYDLVLTNDATMDIINVCLQQLFKK